MNYESQESENQNSIKKHGFSARIKLKTKTIKWCIKKRKHKDIELSSKLIYILERPLGYREIESKNCLRKQDFIQ